MTLNESYISTGEAAKILGMHPLAVQKLIYRGALPAEKIANRWLIRRTVVEELAKTYVPKVGRPRQKRKYTKRSPKWQAN
jgi:excisionase family DNA binding protein